MDAKISGGDIALKLNGDFDTVSGLDEAVQRVRMVASTGRGSFPYNRLLGVDYDAFLPAEQNPAAKLDMLIKEGIADVGGVDAEVISYDAENNSVSIKVTYRGRSAVTEVDISGII